MNTAPDADRRAVRFVAPQQAELHVTGPDDAPCEPDQIMGQTLASLISAGTELNWGFLGERFPSYPGYAAVFRVTQVGDEVTRFRVGDVAYASGKHRSHQRTAERNALPVPEGLTPATAVFARLMGVSMTTLITTRARPGDVVLISGLGLVGNLAAQCFTASGYRVVGSDIDPARCDALQALGAAEAVLAPDDLLESDWAGAVALALDCAGHEQAALTGCRMVRKGGEVVLVGVPWQQRCDLQAQEILSAVFHNYVYLRSGWEWELPTHPAPFQHDIQQNYRTALGWLADGRVRVADLYETVAPADAQRAYTDLMNRAGKPARVFDWA